MKVVGRTEWAIPGGLIPVESTGHEPELTSCDKVAILNTGTESAILQIFVYYQDADPVGPYQITVKGQRVRTIRFNDLIDPEAIILGREFSALVTSDRPVVIQFSREITQQSACTCSGALAYAARE